MQNILEGMNLTTDVAIFGGSKQWIWVRSDLHRAKTEDPWRLVPPGDASSTRISIEPESKYVNNGGFRVPLLTYLLSGGYWFLQAVKDLQLLLCADRTWPKSINQNPRR